MLLLSILPLLLSAIPAQVSTAIVAKLDGEAFLVADPRRANYTIVTEPQSLGGISEPLEILFLRSYK